MRISTLRVILSLSRLDSGIWVLTMGLWLFFLTLWHLWHFGFFCILGLCRIRHTNIQPAQVLLPALFCAGRRKSSGHWRLEKSGIFCPVKNPCACMEYCKFTEENLKACFTNLSSCLFHVTMLLRLLTRMWKDIMRLGSLKGRCSDAWQICHKF